MNTQTLFTIANELEQKGKKIEAIEKYQQIVATDNNNIDAYFKIGELYHQIGQLPEALSAYIKVTDLDKDHTKAQVKIEMIRSILDFFNPDLYNP